MDLSAVVRLLENSSVDKIILIFCLVITCAMIALAFFVVKSNTNTVKNNTSAFKELTTFLQKITTNQALHDQRMKSDINEVRNYLSRVDDCVAGVREDVNAIQRDMATKTELQDVHKTVSIIQGRLER